MRQLLAPRATSVGRMALALAVLADASSAAARALGEDKAAPVRDGVAASPASMSPARDPPGAAARPGPLYAISPWPHVAATAGMLLVTGLGQSVVVDALAAAPACRVRDVDGRCGPEGLWAIDRWSLGASSTAWRIGSDVAEGAAVLLPIAATLLAHGLGPGGAGWAEAGRDILVGVESVAVASLVGTTLKLAARRPRPEAYLAPPPRASASLSFPSGHVAAASAALSAYATTFWLRHPHSRLWPVVLGSGVVVAGATAVGRVLGGMHFTTDVVAGLAIGVVTGVSLPLAYRGSLAVAPVVVADPGSPFFGARGLGVVWRS